MSWSSGRRGGRLALAAALLLLLAACGFHPLYGDEPAFGYDPALAAIKVLPIPDRVGQIIEDSLREQFNPRGADVATRYLLKVGITIVRSDLAIQLNATSLRSRITIIADYTLTTPGREKPLYHDKSTAVTSFNLPSNDYAATVAEDHARAVAARDLSTTIAAKVILFLHQGHTG